MSKACLRKCWSLRYSVKALSLLTTILIVVTSIILSIKENNNHQKIIKDAQWINIVSIILLIIIAVQTPTQCCPKRPVPHTGKCCNKREYKSNIHTFGTLSIFFFTFHPIIGIFGWTDFISPTITSSSCAWFYGLAIMCYNFGKVFMYWIFALRIKNILIKFPNLDNSDAQSHESFSNPLSSHSTSLPDTLQRKLRIYQFCCLVIPTVLWILWIWDVSDDIKPDHAGKPLKYCYPIKSVSIGDYVISALLCVTDVVLSVGALFVYYKKWRAVLKRIHAHQGLKGQKSENNQLNEEEFTRAMILCFIAVFSTAWFTVGIFLWRSLGFILSADSLVNAYCVFCLKFEFPITHVCKNITNTQMYQQSLSHEESSSNGGDDEQVEMNNTL
eukprot:538423_1